MPRPASIAAISAACLLATVASGREGGGVLADEIVAVVDARTILLSELEVEARLRRARESGPQALEAPLETAELAISLERLVDWLVLYAEAERLQVFELAPGEVDRGVAALRAQLGAGLDAFLARHEVEAETLRDIVRRELRVLRYLEGRFRLAARPREADLEAYYRAHEGDFGGRPLAQVAGDVRLRLARERFRQLADEFVRDVRKRARVRILRDFESPDSTTPLTGTAAAPEAAPRTGG